MPKYYVDIKVACWRRYTVEAETPKSAADLVYQREDDDDFEGRYLDSLEETETQVFLADSDGTVLYREDS